MLGVGGRARVGMGGVLPERHFRALLRHRYSGLRDVSPERVVLQGWDLNV